MIQNMFDNQAENDTDDPILLEEKYHDIDRMKSMECIDLEIKYLEDMILEKQLTYQLDEYQFFDSR